MKPRTQFLNQPKRFWANVRTVSEQTGYTVRGTGQIKVPTMADMHSVIQKIGLTVPPTHWRRTPPRTSTCWRVR